MPFDVEKIRGDFPILARKINDNPLVYLDNAATTQKPSCVIERMVDVYKSTNSNIHRGIHYLSDIATTQFEEARETVRKFINAKHNHEIIFTSGTTAGINLVASSFGERFINKGDEIVISSMEHHANIVPWQTVCKKRGASLKVIPIDDVGELLISEYEKLLSSKTRIVAITHVSNALGTVNDIERVIEIAHNLGIPVLVDGAQAVNHFKVDVQKTDADFYVFSGHKMYGPNGTGVLYGKEKFLDEMPPYQTGGEMVDQVSFEKTTFNSLPFKFEAGTPNYPGFIGLAAAIDYLYKVGLDEIVAYENDLVDYSTGRLSEIVGLDTIGRSKNKIGVQSFLLKGVHPFDAGMIIDKFGIAVRTGSHCAQPVMDRFGIQGTIRASLAFYNTYQEIDHLCRAIEKVKEMLS